MAKTINYLQAMVTAQMEEMRRDPNVIIWGEDIGKFGGTFQATAGILAEFGPERIWDFPLSENAMGSMAVGAALYGKRMVVDMMFGDFMSLYFQSIVNEAAKMRFVTNATATCPIVFTAAHGIGAGIGVHHSQSTESWALNAPGVKIVCPSTPRDALGLFKAAIRDNNPVVFLQHKALYGDKQEIEEVDDFILPIGKAEVVQEGKDVTLLANQLMRKFTLAAIPELEKQGISVELIDPRTIKPFDKETVCKSVKKTGRCVIVHECCLTGGYGAEFAAQIQDVCLGELKKPIKRIAYDNSIPAGAEESYAIPSTQDIIKGVTEIVKG